MATPTGTQAVDRAARLVTEVVHAPDSVTFTELAAATGLAKSTTSRLLVALERGGLVRRDDDGRFRPGDVFVRYAWRGGAEAGLVEVARPFLDRLGAQTGETVNLGVARDGLVEQIAQVDSTYLIGGTNWVGRPVPLHCAALGKVLLAYGAARAAARPAGGPHLPDPDQPRRARGEPAPGPPVRLRGHRRGTRARAGRGGRPRLPGRRGGGGRPVGVRAGQPAHPAEDPRGGRAVRDPGPRPVRGSRPRPARPWTSPGPAPAPSSGPGHPGPESPATRREKVPRDAGGAASPAL